MTVIPMSLQPYARIQQNTVLETERALAGSAKCRCDFGLPGKIPMQGVPWDVGRVQAEPGGVGCLSRDPLEGRAGGWGSNRHIPASPGTGAGCHLCRGGC